MRGGEEASLSWPSPSLSLCNEGLSHKWEHDAVLTNTELGALFSAREHKINLEVWRNEAKADTQVPTIFTTWPCIACSETSIHETIAFCTFNVVSWWMRATSKCHPSLWGSQLFSASRNTSSWESLPHYTSIIHWFSLTTRAGPPCAGKNLMTVQKLPGIMWQWLFMHIVNSIISTL